MVNVSGYPDGATPQASEAVPTLVHGAWAEEEKLANVDGLRNFSASLWKSNHHGTKAVLARTDGPLCSVGMVFATEASDNKGLVHCLEHLCFMGTDKYEKGYLDLLASRCGCEGTNAYTEADHTCFEFTAAGEAGLLAVLPVFVDHVLCPSLTEDSFTTEIHHINGRGERQGVVFSEMLGRVTDQQEVLDLERRRATFGEASPYSYEHGGLPDEILKLTRKDIEEYHRRVYTTDNLSIIVSGTFDTIKVLSALGSALDEAVKRGARCRCEQQPFTKALPPLPKNFPRRRRVQFPSDDVSVGTVAYSWRLVDVPVNCILTVTALDVLGRFLAGLPSSPLEQAFVQCNPPVANGVNLDVDLTAEPFFTLELQGVPFSASAEEQRVSEKLCGGPQDSDDDEDADDDDDGDSASEEQAVNGVETDDDDSSDGPNWFEGDVLLERLVDELRKAHVALLANDGDAFKHLQRAVKTEKVDRRVKFEDGPNEFLSNALIHHFIFAKYPGVKEGTPGGILQSLQAHADALECLATKQADYWANLLDTYLIQPLACTCKGDLGGAAEILACPSAVLCMANKRKEDKEAAANAKRLGKKKLKALQDRVDAAEKANKVDLDEERRESFPAPATPDCVRDFEWEMNVAEPPEAGGVEVLEVEVSSSFVELHVSWLLDAQTLADRTGAELRAYLGLFAALMCETNVAGQDYKSVVACLEDEFMSYGASVSCGSECVQDLAHPCHLTLKLTAEPDNLDKLVYWVDRLSHQCEFLEDKVLSHCKRTVAGLKESMREGEAVLPEVMAATLYGPLSPQLQLGGFAQRPFMERCIADAAATCDALHRLRDVISSTSTPCMALVSASEVNIRRAICDRFQDAWRARGACARPSFLRKMRWTARASPAPAPLLPLRHLVVGCAGSDTASISLRASLPLPALAMDGRKSWALRLLCEALSMMEGALSSTVRGKGLAYDVSVRFSAADNSVHLDLSECTNVKKALDAALAVVRDAVEDEDILSSFQLDNARGATVFGLKSSRATPVSVTRAAVEAAGRGFRAAAEVQEWEEILGSITRDDVVAAHSESLLRLCDPSSVSACVVCDPADFKKTAKGFAAALGIEVSKVFMKESLSDCYALVDARIQAALGEIAS